MTRARSRTTAGGFIQRIRLASDAATGRYPFTLPAVAWLARSGGLEPVTYDEALPVRLG